MFNLESGGTGTLVSRIQFKIRVSINKYYLVLLSAYDANPLANKAFKNL